MGLVDSNIPHSTRRGNKTQPWVGVEDLAWMFSPQKYADVIRKAGFRFSGLDFFNLYGGRVQLKNRQFDVITKGKFARPVAVEEVTAPTAPGEDIEITPMASEFDNDGNSQLREKFTVAIPVGESYELYRLQSESNETWTASPLNEEAYFADNLSEGTEIGIHHSLDTTGADGVSGLREHLYEWSYYTQISKERLGLEGGMIAQEEWEDILSGGEVVGKFNHHLKPVEQRLRKQIESGLYFGQLNTNDVTSANTIHGGNQVVLGSQGLRKTLEDRGARLYYGDAFTLDNMYLIKDHFHNTELSSDMGVVLCDSWLMRDVEQSGLSFEDTHGGGQSYKRVLSQVFGAATDDMINVSFRSTYIDGILTTFIEIPSLSDPATFGASSLESMRGQGIYVPTETAQITIDREQKELKNLSLGYLNHQGENRTRVLAVLDGMTGNSGGYTVVNDVDGINVHMLSEYASIIINPEQMILFTKGSSPTVGEE